MKIIVGVTVLLAAIVIFWLFATVVMVSVSETNNNSTKEKRNIMYCDGLYVEGRHVLLNGKPLPALPRPAKSVTQVDGKVFIDGYEYRYGKWRRTLRALWHLIF